MHRIVTGFVVALACGAAPRSASAQSAMRTLPAYPTAEVSVFSGVWSLEPSGSTGLGGRVTMNRSDWLARELSLEVRRRDAYGPAEGIVLVNVRAQFPAGGQSPLGFVTAGVAAGRGTRRRVSPMVGVGLQTVWHGSIAAVRGELQYFPTGLTHERSRARVLVGIVVALR